MFFGEDWRKFFHLVAALGSMDRFDFIHLKCQIWELKKIVFRKDVYMELFKKKGFPELLSSRSSTQEAKKRFCKRHICIGELYRCFNFYGYNLSSCHSYLFQARTSDCERCE